MVSLEDPPPKPPGVSHVKRVVGFPVLRRLPISEKTTLPRIITALKLSNNYVSTLELLNVLSYDEEEDEVSDLKNKSCESFCENKVGVRGSRCPCGGQFCAVHLLPEKHACRYHRYKQFKENIQPTIRSVHII
ncbi:hypothetical protein Lser_V15G35952 [Lactuca serriola]